MITRMSGEASVTASAVSRISRRIFGNCFTTAASPMIDSSSIGNSDVSPSRAIGWPPTPSNRTAPPRRWRSTFIRPAPSRSPDSSVAIRNIFRATLAVGRAGITRANRSRTGRRRRPPRSWPAVRRRWCCRRRPQSRQACAAAAPSTVRGPMVGRSKRRSCPLLGAFTSTPRRGLGADAALARAAAPPAPASRRCPRCPPPRPHDRRSRRRPGRCRTD